MALIEIPKVDSLLLKNLTDEQIKTLYQKACYEIPNDEIAPTTKRDLSRFIEALTTAKACQDEAVRRGGKLARWLFEELTEDLPSKDWKRGIPYYRPGPDRAFKTILKRSFLMSEPKKAITDDSTLLVTLTTGELKAIVREEMASSRFHLL